MKIIEWFSNNGLVGSERKGEIEVDDDATEKEIEEDVREAVFNYFEWGFALKEKDHD